MKDQNCKSKILIYIIGIISSLLTTYYLLSRLTGVAIFDRVLTTTYAAGEFSSSFDVIYEVDDSGKTAVTQNISLANLTTNYYASEYTITIGSDKIEEIQARDGQGLLKTEVKKENNQTEIRVFFNEKVVGKGQILNWVLRYQTFEIAQKIGRIWEINIPRLSEQEQPLNYNVSLTVPKIFGEPAYIFPIPQKRFIWSLPESNSGITLAFGDWQGFKFELNYYLKNNYLIPSKTYLVLPPDTAYQKIILGSIDPQPREITTDQDGNRIADYFLFPKQQKNIKVIGFAQVFSNPKKDFITNQDQDFSLYLQSQEYWEQTDQIKQLASQLKTASAIYNFVVDKLNYDYQKVNQVPTRLGASKILEEPDRAICMEFTDLFIAIARAAGIPAREIDGYAYTTNLHLKPLSLVTNVLHSWPEYWDKEKNTWVQIDPTWGKTARINYFDRFDFNHLTLVIKGKSSTFPSPAKDVKVNFTQNLSVFNRIEQNQLMAGSINQQVFANLLIIPFPIIILGLVSISLILFFITLCRKLRHLWRG